MNRSPDRRSPSPQNAAGSAEHRPGEHRLRELLEPTERAVRRVSRGALERAAPSRQRLRERLPTTPAGSLALAAGAVALLVAVVQIFPQRSAGPPVDLRVPSSREETTAAPPRVTVLGFGRTLLVAPAIAAPPSSPRAAEATVTAPFESDEAGSSSASGSIVLIRRRDS